MKETINMLFKKSALVLAASLLAMGAAHAVPANAQFPLSVTVNVSPALAAQSCSLSATGMMGALSAAYVSGSTAQAIGSGNGTVSCDGTVATTFTVGANAGAHFIGGMSRRALSGTSDYIVYQLKNMMNTSIWDDVLAPVFGGATITGTTSGGAYNTGGFSFNLVVPPGQAAPQGTYTDTVVLTATF